MSHVCVVCVLTINTYVPDRITYFLNQHPRCLARLREEIFSIAPNLDQPVMYNTLRHLPYLNAVINEAQRLRPIARFGFSRVVPKGGIELEGRFIPAGVSHTIILSH
jgi:benzoate 4-monooxygenase